jgi:hypothetical protein
MINYVDILTYKRAYDKIEIRNNGTLQFCFLMLFFLLVQQHLTLFFICIIIKKKFFVDYVIFVGNACHEVATPDNQLYNDIDGNAEDFVIYRAVGDGKVIPMVYRQGILVDDEESSKKIAMIMSNKNNKFKIIKYLQIQFCYK